MHRGYRMHRVRRCPRRMLAEQAFLPDTSLQGTFDLTCTRRYRRPLLPADSPAHTHFPRRHTLYMLHRYLGSPHRTGTMFSRRRSHQDFLPHLRLWGEILCLLRLLRCTRKEQLARWKTVTFVHSGASSDLPSVGRPVNKSRREESSSQERGDIPNTFR